MKRLFTLISITLIAAASIVTSCKKEPIPTIAEIRVEDKDGNPIPYAEVVLACTSSLNLPCEVDITAETDEFGVYRQEFELPTVLQVVSKAVIIETKTSGVPPNLTIVTDSTEVCGETLISIKPEQTSTQTVVLYPC